MRSCLRKSGTVLVALVTVASIAAATCAAADEPLRWKFKVGEKLNYNMVQQMWMLAMVGSKPAKDGDVSWNQYVKDCGPKAQKANAARSAQTFREKYKGKTVNGVGVVDSVAEKPMGKGVTLVVNMNPVESDSPASRVTLNVAEDLKSKASGLKKGDVVNVTGRLVKQGTATSNHEVEATNLSHEQSMNTTMRQEMDMVWDVQGVDDQTGEAVIKQKFDRVKMKMTTPVGGFEYDSKSETAPTGLGAMIAPMYKAMTEGEFEITMTSRGEVKDVKVPEQVLAALKNSPGAAAMGDIATAEGFKKMISQGALVLPKDPPKEGESWNTKVEMTNPAIGKQTVETIYSFEGTKDINGTKYALIRPELKMAFEAQAPAAPDQPQQPQQQQQLQMKIKDQSSDGEILFNIKEGRLHSTTLIQDVTIEANAGGQSMEQKINQKIEVKVTPAGEKEK